MQATGMLRTFFCVSFPSVTPPTNFFVPRSSRSASSLSIDLSTNLQTTRSSSSRRREGFNFRCSSSQEDKEMTDVSGPAAYPLRRCKTIHLVRHGQGFHNVAGEIDRAAYMSLEYFDASLTAKGWQQVRTLRNHVKSTGIAKTIQLVVVSPLTRTMQTAVGAFGGEDVANGTSAEVPLMVDGVGKEKHKAISSRGAPPFVAVEWCREHMGLHPCDQRQSLTTYKSLFPGIDFSNVEEEQDVLWSPVERESDEELFGRARKFVQWVLERNETDIAVVSHSGFLFQLMRAIYDDHCSSTVQKELRTHFSNCEMRSIVLADRRAEGAFKGTTTDFPGGIPEGLDAPSDAAETQ